MGLDSRASLRIALITGNWREMTSDYKQRGDCVGLGYILCKNEKAEERGEVGVEVEEGTGGDKC